MYHNGTKHSYQSIRSNQHYLDWGNQPLPLQGLLHPGTYPAAHDLSLPHVTALSALDTPGLQPLQDSIPDLHSLARLFYYSAGVTKQINHPGGSMYFRAAACTERSTISICTWSATTFRAWRRGSITLAPTTLR